MPAASQLRTYDRTREVVFFKTREAFGALSNMASGYPLDVAGVKVPSTEALYQACRFPHLPEVQKLIISQASPMTAKMKSKPFRNQSRSDWDDVRVAIMKWCVRVKLIQHWTRFGDLLLETGNKAMVEQSRKDPFWGAVPDASGGTLRGANVLGRLLMEVRELLKRKPSELNSVEPVPIKDFSLMGRPIETISRLRLVHSAEPKAEAPERPEDVEPARAKSKPKSAQRKTTSPSPQLHLFEAPQPKAKSKAKSQPAKARYHVVSSQRGGWDVLKDGTKRVSAHCDTKAAATARGRQLASKHKLELVIHDKAGKILQRVKDW